MSTRADYGKLAPESVKALYALEASLAKSTVGHTILDLVKIRASQINGCLFCLDLHSKQARNHGERELRLYHLPLWRESDLFTEKEKAALKWVELLTRPTAHGVEDSDYATSSAQFTEKEVVDLTLAVSAINAWNRLGIAFRTTPGTLDKALGVDKINLQ